MWWALRPLVKEAFRAGEISLTKCRVIKSHTDGAPDGLVSSLEAEIVRCARVMAQGPLGTEIDRLLTQADPEWDAKARKRARKTEPKVSLKKLPRGMVNVGVVVTESESAEIAANIGAQESGVCARDPRSPGVLHRDAFLASFRGERLSCQCGRPQCPHAPSGDQPDSAPKGVLHINADLAVILGISSEGARLRGYGAVPAEVCRELAMDSTWQAIFVAGRRLSTPVNGQRCACTCGGCCCGRSGSAEELVLGRSRTVPAGWMPYSASERIELWRARVEAEPDVDFSDYPDGHGGFHEPPAGALRYVPSADVAQYVRGIFPTCVHPGCGVSSDRCDLDHGVEFDQQNPESGGWTIASNLTPKCRTHHNLKTGKTWRYRMLPDRVLQVTDPLGNHYFRAL